MEQKGWGNWGRDNGRRYSGRGDGGGRRAGLQQYCRGRPVACGGRGFQGGDGGGRGTGLQQYGWSRPVASGGRGFQGGGGRGGGQQGDHRGGRTYGGRGGGWRPVSPAVGHGRGQPSVAPAPARGPADGGSGNGGRGVSFTISVYYADLLAYRGRLNYEATFLQSPLFIRTGLGIIFIFLSFFCHYQLPRTAC